MDRLWIFLLVTSTLVAYGGTTWVTDLQKKAYYIKGGTPGSTATWSYQLGGNQPANGLDIKGGTPGSTGTWSSQFGGNQPGNGLDIKGGTPGSTVIKGGIPGTTDINGGTPGSPGTWSFQFGGNQPGNGLGLRRPSHGKYFVTAFMHNSFSNASPSKDFLFTGTAPSTTVTVSINNSNFKKYVTVAKGETVTVQLPPATENRGSGICPCGAIITSDQDITVMSRNFKETSGDVALIYPVDQWGTVYYIITPTNGPSSHSTEFGVLAREFSTTVTIIFSGTVQFNGRYYQAGDIMTINLQPFQFVQFQSKDDLSGTKVTSQLPVAILAGHSCVPSYADCSHVYEQLQPFESWGTSFFVPGLSFQSNNDLVYVLAFKTTCLEYQSGEKKQKTFIEAGKLMKFEVSAYSSLSMHSLERIQVLLFGTGGKFRSRGFGPFLTKIPDIESFNLAYNIIGQEDFENNLAIIIAKTSSASEITFNGEDLRRAKWTEFPQSEYSWLEYNYGMDSSSNTMQHSTTPFGLLSIGYTRNMAYGSVAPSTQGLVGQFPESKGMQVVKETSKGQRKGLLQNLLDAGGDIISKTGELVEGIGETAGDLKSSIIGGENYGLIPSILHAGGEVIKGTGDIIHGIGDTA